MRHADNKCIPLLSGNAALKKHATQSHTVDGNRAGKAVDGNPNPHYAINGPCANTGIRTDPWWRVDLGQIAMVSEVYIVNRDAAGDMLDGFEVRIGRLPSRWEKFNSFYNRSEPAALCTLFVVPFVHCTIYYTVYYTSYFQKLVNLFFLDICV